MIDIETIKQALLLLLALQVKHVICDGPLQTLQMVRDKSVYLKPLGVFHALIHCAGSFLVLLSAGLPLVFVLQIVLLEFVLHYHIDFTKEKIIKRAPSSIQSEFQKHLELYFVFLSDLS